MPSPTPFPRLRFFDADGAPLSLGFLYPYAAGTTNPLATFQDSAGATPNTHPIQLDANGECIMWLGDSGAYDFRVTNAAGVDQPAPGLNVQSTARSVGTFILPRLASTASASDGAGMSGASQSLTYPVATLGARFNETVSVKDDPFLAAGDGAVDDTAAIKAATEFVGTTGSVVLPPGTYSVTSSALYSIITCGRLVFMPGAVLAPTPGSEFIIDAEVVGWAGQCFDVGKMVMACDCDAASTALRTWTYGFEASDVGKPVCLRYGGALTGAAGVPNFVQNRLPFNTTITGYTSDNQVTLATGPTSAIRQDYVIDGGYSYLNTGIAIVGNGTVEFTPKVTAVDLRWFGAVFDNTTDDAVALNKALQSVGRRYGGTKFVMPNGAAIIGRELKIDVGGCELVGNHGRSTIFRKNSVALERMNMLTVVWRGRYGGGGPTKAAEYWTFTGLSGSVSAPYWGGDWFITEGLTVDGIKFDGNKGNQPTLTPGTGLDGWDAGISTLYMKRVTIKSTCSFVNMNRWGVALSTQSHDSVIEDGAYFDSCDEGAVYVETSNNIVCGAIIAKNSPAAGWNMGAVTYLRVVGGSINAPISTGANNGIYLRNGCEDVDVYIGAQRNCANNGVWLFDESIGSERLKNITISGGSVDGSVNGVVAKYVDGLTIRGVKGDLTGQGMLIEQCTRFDIDGCSLQGATGDVEITSGTSYGLVRGNLCDVLLSGTSSSYLTFDIPSGYALTKTASSTGYIATLERPNFGDGFARHRFGEGGISLTGSTYATFPIDFNGKVMWFNGSTVYIKNGYPTTATDGTVVGTQT
jgi:hypothetical protein